VIQIIRKHLSNLLRELFDLDTKTLSRVECNLQLRDNEHGDIATNAALVLSKALRQPPQQIAQIISQKLTHPLIESVAIAGPGFINLTLKREAFAQFLDGLHKQGAQSFVPEAITKQKINVEFISANPTGPLHIGHGRGGIIGDVLGNILAFIGHDVTKEFYINDAGNQITKLGNSFKIRCLQELGQTVELPEDGYQGQYLVELANVYVAEHGQSVLEHDETAFAQYALNCMQSALKNTLSNYGINFDIWFSEKSLHTSGKVEQALAKLTADNLAYEQDGALWFRSTQFGDDKDRVLRKANGTFTYAASDMAYLVDKIKRGFKTLVMVLGQDHHGYVARLKGGMQALGYDPSNLNAIIYQLVTLKKGDEQVRMSKRKGTMITLHDVVETVGTDVARFFYLNRKAEAHLDFDVELAAKKSDENPVFYIQYAYVRTGSIISKSKGLGLEATDSIDVTFLNAAEQAVIKKIATLSDLLDDIGKHHQTHLLTYYTLELAQAFHAYYAKQRIIEPDQADASKTRLRLIVALRTTLKLCMQLLGIDLPERM
jgi:arginyl-tRNA synthetase